MTSPTYNKNMPVRREPGKRRSFVQFMLAATSLASGAMLGLAVPNLISGTGSMVAIKAGLLALSGTGIAYAVNRLAFERGAPLAVIGYPLAAITSVASIGIVGGGLFAATFSGLVLKDVEQLRLEMHGAELSDHVASRSRAASQATRIIPVVAASAADFQQKVACETKESCISGNTETGRGPVARALEEKLGRAQAILLQIETGDSARKNAADTLTRLQAEYQSAAVSSDTDEEARRERLQSIDLKIRQKIAELDEALPLTLLQAYADELKDGTLVPAQPEATRSLNAIMRGHGETLESALESIPSDNAPAPAFPRPTGVAETFSYLGHFAPIAAVTAVVELVFPLSLWIYTALTLSWSAYRVAPPAPARPHEDDETVRRLLPPPDDENRKTDRPTEWRDRRNDTHRRHRGRPNGHDRSNEL